MIWYMIWYDMIWYDMILYYIILYYIILYYIILYYIILVLLYSWIVTKNLQDTPGENSFQTVHKNWLTSLPLIQFSQMLFTENSQESRTARLRHFKKWRLTKSWVYPQLSSILFWDFWKNHPATGVHPWLWQPVLPSTGQQFPRIAPLILCAILGGAVDETTHQISFCIKLGYPRNLMLDH